ncbi:unnamed protein product [Cuscuta epithymum]|uniref:Uncharacterized protein n=1 Tax=Cuscuta epithymum TaxID=186058 RepID=A0AAV0G4Z6_9ASTE|nr:unnamed protein product [Cuscuta epithymum]
MAECLCRRNRSPPLGRGHLDSISMDLNSIIEELGRVSGAVYTLRFAWNLDEMLLHTICCDLKWSSAFFPSTLFGCPYWLVSLPVQDCSSATSTASVTDRERVGVVQYQLMITAALQRHPNHQSVGGYDDANFLYMVKQKKTTASTMPSWSSLLQSISKQYGSSMVYSQVLECSALHLLSICRSSLQPLCNCKITPYAFSVVFTSDNLKRNQDLNRLEIIGKEESVALLKLLKLGEGEDKSFEWILQEEFKSEFKPIRYIEVCATLAAILEDTVLNPSNRLVPFAIVHQACSSPTFSSDPFLPILMNVIGGIESVKSQRVEGRETNDAGEKEKEGENEGAPLDERGEGSEGSDIVEDLVLSDDSDDNYRERLIPVYEDGIEEKVGEVSLIEAFGYTSFARQVARANKEENERGGEGWLAGIFHVLWPWPRYDTTYHDVHDEVLDPRKVHWLSFLRSIQLVRVKRSYMDPVGQVIRVRFWSLEKVDEVVMQRKYIHSRRDFVAVLHMTWAAWKDQEPSYQCPAEAVVDGGRLQYLRSNLSEIPFELEDDREDDSEDPEWDSFFAAVSLIICTTTDTP